LRLQQLVMLPLLFAACTALIFCTSKASVYVVISCNYDIAGRYATPLVLSLPFFFAAIFTMATMSLSVKAGVGTLKYRYSAAESRGAAPGGVSGVSPELLSPPAPTGSALKKPVVERGVGMTPYQYGFFKRGPGAAAPGGVSGVSPDCSLSLRSRRERTKKPTREKGLYGRPAALCVLFAFLLAYVGMQAWTYGLTDQGRTFQSAYCLEAPASNEPIIAYMQQEHISYAWASNWLAYGIVFKTNSSIIVADPLPYLPRSPNIDRIPANTQAVRHADRPSLLVFVHHNDAYPLLLQYLDQQRVTYKAARFPSQPGIDVLVVTPMSRTVSPFESPVFQNIFTSCND